LEEQKVISINIPVGMYDWLEKHRDINRSQLFRKAVKGVMNGSIVQRKVSPLMYLIPIMGIVFSIALIGIAVTPTPIHNYARGLMALLGGVLAISTAILYYKESKEVSGE